MTALKAGLPVAVRQLFSFIAVATWGLRFTPRDLRFSQRGLRFSQRGRRFTLVHGVLGLRFWVFVLERPGEHCGHRRFLHSIPLRKLYFD